MGEIQKFGRGPFDRAIVELFSRHLSAEEVSQAHPINGALSPAQCLDRLGKLLKNKDILDAITLAKLNLEDAYYLRNRLRAQLEKAEFIDKDSAATFIKSIDAIEQRLKQTTAGYEDAMIRMQEMHARVMAEAIAVTYDKAALKLSQEFNVPLEDSYRILREQLPEAVTMLEAEVVE